VTTQTADDRNGGNDGSFRLWETVSGKGAEVRQRSLRQRPFDCLFTHGKVPATGTSTCRFISGTWRRRMPQQPRRSYRHSSLAFLQRFLMASGSCEEPSAWDLEADGAPLPERPQGRREYDCLYRRRAFSPRADRRCGGIGHRHARYPLSGHKGPVWSFALSPDAVWFPVADRAVQLSGRARGRRRHCAKTQTARNDMTPPPSSPCRNRPVCSPGWRGGA
jgi:hypothetical protein